MAQAPRKGGDVVIAISQAPPSLDAQITSAQAARNVNLHMYETLYARDESAKPVPELAEGVNIAADGLTYTFPIRKGVKFHNGKELDAKDVAASIERYRKVGASPALVAAIEKIDASGPQRGHDQAEAAAIDLPGEHLLAARADRDLSGERSRQGGRQDRVHRHRAVSSSSSTGPTAM